MNSERIERLDELLADQVIFGLSKEELMELRQLKTEFSDWEQHDSLEKAAAAVSLLNLHIDKQLPSKLRSKILADAGNYFDSVNGSENVFNIASKKSINPVSDSIVENNANLEPKRPFWQWLGWAVAAAACVALAINLLTARSQPLPPEIVQTTPTNQTPIPKLLAAQEREQFLARTPDIVQTSIAEANPKEPKNISGDVVWSNAEQKGYVRFRGMPVNDSNRETYQLWIVDGAQNPKTPISGGVFDIDKNGEVVIPINAQIKVKQPKSFAVTKEKPGGVVVSQQKEVMAIAKI